MSKVFDDITGGQTGGGIPEWKPFEKEQFGKMPKSRKGFTLTGIGVDGGKGTVPDPKPAPAATEADGAEGGKGAVPDPKRGKGFTLTGIGVDGGKGMPPAPKPAPAATKADGVEGRKGVTLTGIGKEGGKVIAPVLKPAPAATKADGVEGGKGTDGTAGAATGLAGKPGMPPRGDGFYDWYADLVRKEYERRARDREEQEGRLKREKTMALVGAGLGAISDAYNNARYGTPYPDPAGSLSGKWRERYDRLLEGRRKDSMEYLGAMAKLEDLRSNMDYRNDAIQYRKDTLDLRNREEERRVNVAKANIEYTMARTGAIKSREDVDLRIAEAKIALMNAGVREKEASAEAKRIVSQSQAYKNYKNGDAAVTRARNAVSGRKANPMGGSNTGKKPNPMR